MRHHAIAAALATAAFLAPGGPSQAASADPTGYWMKPDAERESKIQVFKCGKKKSLLCAKIAWLKDPYDSKGKPLRDVRNANTSLRSRQIVGLTIFSGLAPSAPSTWSGKIYNPEDGNTYTATLTVVSRKEIKLRGCKAWLLCGEKMWLKTSAPPEETPAEVKETEQIEASAPASAPAKAAAFASVAPASTVSDATGPGPAPEDGLQAAEDSAPMAEEPPVESVAPKTVPISYEMAASTPPPAEIAWRQGYSLLQVSAESPTPARFSGENVSSMFVMAEPIESEMGSNETHHTTAAIQSDAPVPVPQPKPKAKAKPVVAAAAAKAEAKPRATAKPAVQGAPAPQEAAAETGTEGETAEPAETADAAMSEEAVPLTRRQKRLLRRQQQNQGPFLPWLR